jgi:hypothetical protein
MGLAAKRAIEEYKTSTYPKYKKQIDDAAGFNVDMDVQWDTLANDDFANMYEAGFSKVFFIPLAEAFKAVCSDEMGKSALKAALKKVIVNGASGHNPNHWTFDKGILTLQHEPFTNMDDVKERTKALTHLLEKHL